MIRKKNYNNIMIRMAFFMLVVCGTAVILWLLFKKTETHISDNVARESTSSLECKTSSPIDAFFKSETAQKTTHRLVATFKGNILDNISYDFEGVYDSRASAKNDEAWLRSDYNLWFRNTGISPERYSPNFAVVNDKVKILIYSEREKLNKTIAPIFYLTDEIINQIDKHGAKELKVIYEEKGFICTFND